jgi:hypothetical protein
MAKTTRASEARRLKFTPALLANVRRRFEGSDEPLSSMAADLGCCITTLRGIAQREGWVHYVKLPRDLTPAARLLERAEGLALSLPPRSGGEGRPPELAQQAQADGVGGLEGAQEPPTPDPSPPRATRAGGGETDAVPILDQVRAAIAALHADVAKELADFKAFRASLKGKPLGLLERERVARTMANLSATLHRLQVMLSAAPAAAATENSETPYDDMPADLDAFRNELARRIRLFVAGRRARSGADAIAGDDAAAPQP